MLPKLCAKPKEIQISCSRTVRHCITMFELPDNEDVEKEIEWIRNMHARHQEISSRIEAFISAKINDDKAINKSNPLQLEKIQMPSF